MAHSMVQELHLVYASTLVDARRPGDALKAFQGIVERWDANIGAHLGLAQTLHRMDRYPAAASAYETTLKVTT